MLDIVHLRPVVGTAKVGQGHLFEHLFRRLDGLAPGVDQPARHDGASQAVSLATEIHPHERAFEGFEDFSHADVFGGTGQAVAARGAARSVHQVGALQEHHDLPQILLGNSLPSRDFLYLHRLAPFVTLNQIRQREQAIISFRSDFHAGFNLYTLGPKEVKRRSRERENFIGNYSQQW